MKCPWLRVLPGISEDSNKFIAVLQTLTTVNHEQML